MNSNKLVMVITKPSFYAKSQYYALLVISSTCANKVYKSNSDFSTLNLCRDGKRGNEAIRRNFFERVGSLVELKVENIVI